MGPGQNQSVTLKKISHSPPPPPPNAYGMVLWLDPSHPSPPGGPTFNKKKSLTRARLEHTPPLGRAGRVLRVNLARPQLQQHAAQHRKAIWEIAPEGVGQPAEDRPRWPSALRPGVLL